METEDDTEKDTYEKTDKAIEICKERERQMHRGRHGTDASTGID